MGIFWFQGCENEGINIRIEVRAPSIAFSKTINEAKENDTTPLIKSHIST